MQRYMKAQSVASGGDGNLGAMNQAVLEINPKHPIIQDLERMVKGDKENEQTKNFASLIYDVASMTGGYEIEDAGDFAKRVMSLMTTKAQQDAVQEADVVEEDKESDGESEKPIEPEVIA